MMRFLMGSALLFVGTMVMASAAVTVVGLPVGMFVFAAGLQLLMAPSRPRST
jgi:predicted Co/Zn/Cd cation transporter (cation efflux family)